MNTCVKICIVTICIAATAQSRSQRPNRFKLSEDGRLLFPGLAVKYGFPAQQENITTDDGYILTMFHIPGNTSRPVLLIHGNTPTSDCWISRGNGSLAIALAKQGHDVWAINLRGSRYSRRHVSLDPDRQPGLFFNYSFFEQGIYDVPASIDFILQKTGQTQLAIIGHSVGTTLLYVMGAERPEYNEKIKIGISLAPISFLQNVRGLARVGIVLWPTFHKLLADLNVHEIFDYKRFSTAGKRMCLAPFGYDLCVKLIMSVILGSDPGSFEPEFLQTFVGHYPGGTSVKIFSHLVQISLQNKFAKFDYGAERNLKVYGRIEPAEINLATVTMPSAIIVGREDFLGTVADADMLRRALPNVVHYQVLPYKKFNHADFIWGRYMTENLFPHVLNVLEKYV